MCPLSTFENRMTARKGERSIVTILQRNGAMNTLITAYILRTGFNSNCPKRLLNELTILAQETHIS